MKKMLFTTLLILVIVSTVSAQKIDFSINLGCDGEVHTNNSTAIDKNGNIFVAGGIRNGLQVTADAFQQEYNRYSGGRARGDIYLMKLSPEDEILYSTYLGGSQNEYMIETSNIGDDKLILIFTSTSEDFPTTIEYAEKDSTNLIVLVKFDLNNN